VEKEKYLGFVNVFEIAGFVSHEAPKKEQYQAANLKILHTPLKRIIGKTLPSVPFLFLFSSTSAHFQFKNKTQ
jgi:hypothetical protein